MLKEFLDTYLKKLKFIRHLNYSTKPQYKIYNRFELNENSIFLDFGANKGEVTQYVKDNFNCKTESYEPDKFSYKKLYDRFKTSKINKTLISATSIKEKNTKKKKTDLSLLVAERLSKKAIEKKISTTLKPITEDIDQTISSEVRAIVFNVFLALGTMLIGDHGNTIKNMTEHDKAAISQIGLRIGVKFFFMPNFLKKGPMELNALLWKIFYEFNDDNAYPLPTDGRVSFITNLTMPEHYWKALGYICINNFNSIVYCFY